MKEMMKNNISVMEERGINEVLLNIYNVNINQDSYESKILLEENIAHLLKGQIAYESDKEILRFDVSGTISLEEFIKNRKLKKQDLCMIVNAINEMLMTLENYLVSENSILLDMTSIRMENDKVNGRVLKFVAIPNLKADFSYELSKFLIRILRYVDEKDNEALTLAYSLFVRSSKDNYSISDLMELIEIVQDEKKNFDINDLKVYDEEIAETMVEDESIIESTEDLMNEDFGCITLNRNIEELKEQKTEIIMDKNTKDILREELFEKFDEPIKESKIIKLKKKIKEIKPKCLLNGHIKVLIWQDLIIPIICILFPLAYYLLYGMKSFINKMPIIVMYEIVLITLFTISNIQKEK